MPGQVSNQDGFFNIHQQPEMTAYFAKVKEGKEEAHGKIMGVVRENIRPQTELSPKEGGALSGWNFTKGISGHLISIPSYLVGTIGSGFKKIGEFASNPVAKTFGFGWNVFVNQMASMLEGKSKKQYQQKGQWLKELREKLSPDQKDQIEILDRLQQLHNMDKPFAIAMMIEKMTQQADAAECHEWGIDIEEAFKKGDLADVNEQIKDFFENVSDLLDDTQQIKEFKKTLEVLQEMIQPELNSFNDTLTEVAAHDIQEVIARSPLPTLYKLKSELQNAENSHEWRDSLKRLQNSIDAKSSPRTKNLLSEVERLANKGKTKQATEIIDEMAEALLDPTSSFIAECLKFDRFEIGKTILEGYPENLQISAIFESLDNHDYEAAIVEIDKVLLGSDFGESEKQALRNLRQTLKVESDQILLQALLVVNDSQDENIAQAASSIRMKLQNQIYKKEEKEIRKLVHNVENTVNKELKKDIKRLIDIEKQNHIITDDDVNLVIKESNSQQTDILSRFKDNLPKLDTSKARLEELEQLEGEVGNADVVELLGKYQEQNQAMQKDTSGILRRAIAKIKTSEAGGIPEVLTNTLTQVAETEGKEFLQTHLKDVVEGAVERYVQSVNGNAQVPTRAEVIQRLEDLKAENNSIGKGSEKMVQAATDFVLQQIERSGAQETRDGQVILNVGQYMLDQEGKESEKLIHFASLGPLVLAMDREDFKMVVEIAVHEALLQGKTVLTDSANGQNGYEFVCDLAGNACAAMREVINNPQMNIQWNDQAASKELVQKIFGENGEKLGFTPFVQQIVTGVLAPGTAGSVPFHMLGVEALGPQIVQQIYRGDVYKEMFDDVLANTMKKQVEELTKDGNIYDYIFKPKGKAQEQLELTSEEKKLKESLGELALEIFAEIDPDLLAEMEALQKKDAFINCIGDLMIPTLREYLMQEINARLPEGEKIKSHKDITPDMMYDFALGKGAEGLRNVVEGKQRSKEDKESMEKEAIQNLGEMANFARPLVKHKILGGMIVGAIIHFLEKITIKPIIFIINNIVKGFCKLVRKDFTKTLWYMRTEGRKQAFKMKEGKRQYKILRDIVQNPTVWKQVYDRAIHQRVLNPESLAEK